MLLSVKNLDISFKGIGDKSHQVVHNANFELAAGKTLGLVGESGSGKSVTAMSIMRLLPNNVIFGSKSSIVFDGFDVLKATKAQLRSLRGKGVGYVFQEPMTALNPLHMVGDQIAEMVIHHENLSKSEVKQKVFELFKQVQLNDFENRYSAYPHQLSGGQRQRIMIAMAIACKPKLLIADEPTTALDVTVQAEIVDLLKHLAEKNKMALLLISHNLGMVKKMADDVIIMQNGYFIEIGKTKDIFKNPQHEYTKLLLSSIPSCGPEYVDIKSPIILKTKDIQVNFSSKPIWFWQKPEVFKAVKSFNCYLKKGETLGIVGESGSGKTTAALAILNLLPHQGKTAYLGSNIADMDKKELRKIRQKLQIIFQDPFGSLNPRFSIEQIISEGLLVHEPELSKDSRIKKVKKSLKDVGLPTNFIYRYPHELSGGQRQRIAIARSLILGPKIIILDEPTSALDHSTQAEVLDLLRNLQEKHGLSYILISHDLSVIRAMSHRIIVMQGGNIIEEGRGVDIMNHPKEAYTQSLINSAFEL